MGHLLSLPLIAVGAAFDFHAGTLGQAPPSWQRAWLSRLRCESRRLWRRYVYLNPAYAALVLMQALRLSRFLSRLPRLQRQSSSGTARRGPSPERQGDAA
jgi:N-acetylglucosaminyldiphosphoundecaprenol N-acetyl-beta-D-mannosaminyltransferase